MFRNFIFILLSEEEKKMTNWTLIGWRLLANQMFKLLFWGGTGTLFRQHCSETVRLLLHFKKAIENKNEAVIKKKTDEGYFSTALRSRPITVVLK